MALQYTDESLTIQELAYLLWATQGVRKVTMGGKGSLRTVPSSGGRNPFETYLAINRVRGVAVSFVGFINSATAFFVTFIFPWELSTIGNAYTFLIYGLFAVVGLILIMRILPETKGRSLEELETILIRE